jgi:hypothetical protein
MATLAPAQPSVSKTDPPPEKKPEAPAVPQPPATRPIDVETERVAKSSATGTSGTSGGGRAAPKSETLSPEAASDLAEAEAALEAGKNADAIRLAQHSLYAQKSGRAYAIIVRAHCAQGDLGNAKAALSHVAARDRAAVLRTCGKLGVDLH